MSLQKLRLQSTRLGFIEATFPPGYDEGRLYATQAAEDWFMTEKAKLEESENKSAR